MRIIYSRWDEGAQRWRNKPAIMSAGMDLLCTRDDHSRCNHEEGGAYTSCVALRGMEVESILFTKETVFVKLVPKGAK